MQKSQYSDPAIQDHGFVNHIHHIVRDLGVYPGTTEPLIECYQIELLQNLGATSGTGGKPRNLALFRKALAPHADPSTGTWQLLKMWQEGVDYDDASAAGSVDMLPDGTLHISMAFGKKNAAGATTYQPWEASVARATFAPAIVRLPSGGTGTDPAIFAQLDAHDRQIAALQTSVAQIETALGNLQPGGISAADRATLDRAARFFAALKALWNVIGMA